MLLFRLLQTAAFGIAIATTTIGGAEAAERGWTSVRPAWQVGAGFNLPLTDVLTAVIGVRYVAGIGANKIGPDGDDAPGGSSWELEGPEGRLGLRVSF